MKSTRFSIDNISIQNFEAFDYSFEIDCRFKVVVRAETKTVAGQPDSQSGDVLYKSTDEYRQALKEHAQIESSRAETLSELLALVRSGPYGQIDQDYFLHQYDRRILHQYACPNCGGNGRVSCGSCNGCGKVNCSGCGGRGQRQAQRSVYDNYTKTNRWEYYYETCYSCLGGGKVKCSSCGGSGRVTCGHCGGQGSLTDVSLLNSIAVPEYSLIFPGQEVDDYIRQALYKAGLSSLGELGQIKESESLIEAEQRTVRARYAAVLPFARFRTPVKLSQAEWILYGDPPRIFDSGQILEVFLEADFQELKRVTPRGKLSFPFIGARSRRALADFMESEVHQDLLEGNLKGVAGDDLREKLNRSFSQTYIDESLTDLETLTRSIVRWSNIKWVIGLALVLYLALAFYWAAPFEVGDHAHTRGFVYYTKAEKIYYPKNIHDVRPVIFSSMSYAQALQARAGAIGGTMCELGLKVGLIFSAGAFLARWYRSFWFKRTGGRALADWIKFKKINTNRFFIFFLAGLASLATLLVFFPYWLNKAGLIFGLLPRLPFL